MTKKGFVFRKGLVIGIIVCFVGTSVIPSITTSKEIYNSVETENQNIQAKKF